MPETAEMTDAELIVDYDSARARLSRFSATEGQSHFEEHEQREAARERMITLRREIDTRGLTPNPRNLARPATATGVLR